MENQAGAQFNQVLRDLLEFAKLEDMAEVTVDRFKLAMGGFLSEDQVMAVNVAI